MIKRHIFAKEKLANQQTLDHYKSRLQKSYSRMTEGRPVNLYALKDTPLDVARTHIIKCSHGDVFSNLELCLQLGIGHFKRVLAEGLVEININDLIYELSPLDDGYGASFYDWFFLFSLANLIGSKESVAEVVDLDVERINSVAHPFWSVGVKYLKGYVKNNKEVVSKSIEQIRQLVLEGAGLLIDESQRKSIVLIEGGAELLGVLWSPIFELYDDVFYGSADQFNLTLESYVSQKKEYIINQELEDDPRYWVDFPLLGCCAYAIDQGLEITVETEYAPRWLYERIFLS